MKITRINRIARISKVSEDSDYQGQHTPPAKDVGFSLDNLSVAFPEDIYSSDGARLYGDHFPSDSYCHSVIVSSRGRPNKKIKVYRAVPDVNSDIKKEINKHLEIIQYCNKFGFFPVGNEIVRRLREELPEDMDYDLQQKAIYDRLNDIVMELDSRKSEAIKINAGDWVTLSLDYAKLHGQSNLNNNYKIIQRTVLAKDLYTDGSINEWGWQP